MDARIQKFMAETGADVTMATKFLEGQHWDLTTALQAYSSLKSKLQTIESTTVPEEKHSSGAVSHPKLQRRISNATGNDTLMTKVRSKVERDFNDDLMPRALETPIFTFTLPDLTIYPDDFREYLEKELLQSHALAALEEARKLNWWKGTLQKLWPLNTTGDGNCLLHAASLSMWGIHDRLLTLRKVLHEYMMKNKGQTALWRRWRWKQTQMNKLSSLILTEEEWKKEWDIILSLSSSEPKIDEHRPSIQGTTANVYQGLEDIHVMALAQIIKRPIIVVAETYLKDVRGNPFAPIPFGGIYLPLDCPPRECHRSPLLLCYHLAHFSGLVAMDTPTHTPPAAVPLTDTEEEMLPLNFLEDPGQGFLWNSAEEDLLGISKISLSSTEKEDVLRKYLDVKMVPVPQGENQNVFKKSKAAIPQTSPFETKSQTDDDLMSFDWNHLLNAGENKKTTTTAFPTAAAATTVPRIAAGATHSGLPGAITYPGIPSTATYPVMPLATTHPGIPAMSTHPGIPPMSTQPGIPAVSTHPGIPAMSTHPGIPAMSTHPGIPAMSTHPGMAAMTVYPRIPIATTYPGVPAASTHPRMPAATAYLRMPTASNAVINNSTSYQHSKPVVQTQQSPAKDGQQYILCAIIQKDNRPVYQDQMKNNYIISAKEQFQRSKKGALASVDTRVNAETTQSPAIKTSLIKFDIFEPPPTTASIKKRVRFAETISEVIHFEEVSSEDDSEECTSRPCQNPACDFFGNRQTNYFCSTCWINQPKEEYTVTKVQSQDTPSQNKNEKDCAKTCKNSTCTFYGNPKTEGYCSKCWIEVTSRSTSKQSASKDNSKETNCYPCYNSSCTFFGNPQTFYFCSKCYGERLLTM